MSWQWSADDSAVLTTYLPLTLVHALQQSAPSVHPIALAYEQLAAVLARIIPFVPAPIVDLRLRQPHPQRLAGRSLTGTVLQADLSGFTALSAELARTGRQGSEEISSLINRLFTTLLDDIAATGGGGVQFGGDAFTAFFDTHRLGSQHAMLACRAALQMQERMQAFAATPTSQGVFPLRLRIAVHSGTLFLAELGDDQQTTLFITGRTLQEVATAEEQAAPGEVLISDTTLHLLDTPHVCPRQGELHLLSALPPVPAPPLLTPIFNPQPPAPTITDLHLLLQRIHIVQPYVPPAILRRFTSDTPLVGEFRPVTVFFAGFPVFDRLLTRIEASSEQSRAADLIGQVATAYYTHLQKVVHQYGGSINKLDMVSTGNRLLALFGAPITHEDDPARAVQVALDLPTILMDIHQSITTVVEVWLTDQPDQPGEPAAPPPSTDQRGGIASGTVFAGVVGGAQHHEYTVMGTTVNLAARLLTAAEPGNILLAARTYSAVKHTVAAHPLPPLTFKGITHPIPVVRLLGQEAAPLATPRATRAPLIGRDTELSRLQELATRVLTPTPDAGGIAVLIGEPGVGKSRLIDELVQVLEDGLPSAQITQSTCQSYEQAVPYAVAGRLLRRVLYLPPGQREMQAATLQYELDQLVPAWSRFAPLLNPLLNLSLPETVLTRALTPEQRFERLCDLMIAIFRAIAQQQPLILVADDLHWADASSREMLARLANELAGVPLLLLLVYRSTFSLEEPWLTLPHCDIIWLHELTLADSQSLLHALLRGEPPALLIPLIERMNGTPLFLEETVHYLLDSGLLQRTPTGEWECNQPISQITVPAQLEQLIVARLDRLQEDTRLLAQIAAVIGQELEPALLRAVCVAANVPPAAYALEELVSSAFLTVDIHEAQTIYRFKHALLHDVVYNSLLFATRRELHTKVAATIEHLYAAELDDYRVVLGHHYLHAGQPAQAFPHFMLAAQQSQARYAHPEALALYEQALAIAPWQTTPFDLASLNQAITLYENLGDVLTITSDYARARMQYEHLLTLLNQFPYHTHLLCRASLQRKIATTYEQQGNYEPALFWLLQAQHTLETATPATTDTAEQAIEQARILSDISWVNFRQNNLDQSQLYLEQALIIISLYDAYTEQARILNQLGGIAWHRGDLDTARYYVQQSLAISEKNNNLVEQANLLNNLGILVEMQGNVEESIQYSTRALAINQQLGRQRDMALNALNIGWAFDYTGNYEQAQSYFSQAAEYSVAVHDDYHRMRALLGLGDVYAATNHWAQAQAALEQSLALTHRLHLPTEQLELYVALANVAVQQGNLNQALHYYAHAQTLAQSIGPESEEYGQFQRLEARITFAQGRTEQALLLLHENEQLFRQLQNTPEAERTRKLLAELTAASG